MFVLPGLRSRASLCPLIAFPTAGLLDSSARSGDVTCIRSLHEAVAAHSERFGVDARGAPLGGGAHAGPARLVPPPHDPLRTPRRRPPRLRLLRLLPELFQCAQPVLIYALSR